MRIFTNADFKFFTLTTAVLFLSASCTDFFEAGEGALEKAGSQVKAFQASTLSDTSGQIMAAGSLMLKGVATELQTQGLTLAQVKAVADKAEKKLTLAGQLSVSDNSSLGLVEKSKVNPLSLAGNAVLDAVTENISDDENLSKSHKNSKLLKKVGGAAQKSLKNIKDDSDLSALMTDSYYAGAIAKVTSNMVGKLKDFGVSSTDFKSELEEMKDEVLNNAKAAGVLSDNTKLVGRIVSGIAQGASKIKYDGVKRGSEGSPAKIANTLMFEVYNKETGSSMDSSNASHYVALVEIILEGAVDSMDSSISDAMSSIVEVSVAIYDQPATVISNIIESVNDIYNESGVEVPADISTMVVDEQLMDEMVSDGVITQEEADSMESTMETAATTLEPVTGTIPSAEYDIYERCSLRFSDFTGDFNIQMNAQDALAEGAGSFTCITESDFLCPVNREYYSSSINWTKNATKAYLCNLTFVPIEDGLNPNLPYLNNFDLSVYNNTQQGMYYFDNQGYVGDVFQVEIYVPYDPSAYQFKLLKSNDCNGSILTDLTSWGSNTFFSYTVTSADSGGCTSLFVAVKNNDGVNNISAQLGDGIAGRDISIYPAGANMITDFYTQITSGYDDYQSGGPYFRSHLEGDTISVQTNAMSTNGLSLTYGYAYAKLDDCNLAGASIIANPVVDFLGGLIFYDLGSGVNLTSKSFNVTSGLGCYIVRTTVKDTDGSNGVYVDGAYYDAVRYELFSVVDYLNVMFDNISYEAWDSQTSSWVFVEDVYFGGNYDPAYNEGGMGPSYFGIGDQVRYTVNATDPNANGALEYALYKDNYCTGSTTSGPIQVGSWQTSNQFTITFTADDLNYSYCISYMFQVRNAANEPAIANVSAPMVTNGELPPQLDGGVSYSSDNVSFYPSTWELQDMEGYLGAGSTLYVKVGTYSDPNGDPVTPSVYIRSCDYNTLYSFAAMGGDLFSITLPAETDCYLEVFVALQDNDGIFFVNEPNLQTDVTYYMDGLQLPSNLPPQGPISYTFDLNATAYPDVNSMPQQVVGDNITVTVSGVTDAEGDTIYYTLMGRRWCYYEESFVLVPQQTSNILNFTITSDMDNQNCSMEMFLMIDDKMGGTFQGNDFNGVWYDFDLGEYIDSLNIAPEINVISSSVTHPSGAFVQQNGVNNFVAGKTISLSAQITEVDGNNVSYAIGKKATCNPVADTAGPWTAATPITATTDWDIVDSIVLTQADIDNCTRFSLLIKDDDATYNHPSGTFDVEYYLFTVNRREPVFNGISVSRNGSAYTEGSGAALNDTSN